MTEMSEKAAIKWDEAITGMVICLAVILLLGYGFLQINDRQNETSSYRLSASFYNGGGIQPGNAIHVAGVQVGIVENVSLLPELAQARVDMLINADYSFPEDSEVHVESAGLFSGQIMIITPGDSERHMVDQEKFVNVVNSQSLEAQIGGAVFGAGLE